MHTLQDALCRFAGHSGRSHAPWLLVAVALLTWSDAGQATSVRQLSHENMVRISPQIVEGTVTFTRSEWNADRTQIHTIVTVRVDRSLKGPTRAGASLTLRMLGGRVGDTVQTVVGGPTFAADDRVILFVEEPSSLMPIAGIVPGEVHHHDRCRGAVDRRGARDSPR